MYRYCSVSPRECKCIHLYSDTLVRYIGIQHTYTSMKPNETAIHQMYRTSIQLYICTHVETEPNIGIQRYSAIQRYICITTPQAAREAGRGGAGDTREPPLSAPRKVQIISCHHSLSYLKVLTRVSKYGTATGTIIVSSSLRRSYFVK